MDNLDDTFLLLEIKLISNRKDDIYDTSYFSTVLYEKQEEEEEEEKRLRISTIR